MKVKIHCGFIFFTMQVLCGDIVQQNDKHTNIQQMPGGVMESNNTCTGADSNGDIIPSDKSFDRDEEKQNDRKEDLLLIPMLADASLTEHTEDLLGTIKKSDFVQETGLMLNKDESSNTTDEGLPSLMEETENQTKKPMNSDIGLNTFDEVLSFPLEETVQVYKTVISMNLEENSNIIGKDKFLLSEQTAKAYKKEVSMNLDEECNIIDEDKTLLPNKTENDNVKESEIVASNNFSFDEARNVIVNGPGANNDIEEEIVTSNKGDNNKDKAINSEAEGLHAKEDVIMAIKTEKHPIGNSADCEQNLLTTTDDQNQENHIPEHLILTLINVPYDTLALHDPNINNEKARCKKPLEYVYSSDELYKIHRSMLNENLKLTKEIEKFFLENKKFFRENKKMTEKKHTPRYYEFDYKFGIRSAFLRHSGGMQKYDKIIIDVDWCKVSFILRPNRHYFDFEMFYINHKHAFLPKSTMDRRIECVTSASSKQEINIYKCKQMVRVIESLENIAFDMNEEDLIKFFKSNYLKQQAELKFIDAREITQIITSKTDFTYTMVDLDPEQKNEINHIFEYHAARIINSQASILFQRDLFINCMSLFFFYYDRTVNTRFFRQKLSNLLRFMPEFNLYLIWKFKELYKWNVDLEASKHKAKYLKEEMAHIKNILTVLSQLCDKTYFNKKSSKPLHLQIRDYRAFIIGYLKRFYSDTLTYCLYKQGCEIDLKKSTIEGDKLSMIFFLLAFMDESEILSTNNIKDNVNQIKLKNLNEKTEKNIMSKEKIKQSNNENNEHEKVVSSQAYDSKQNPFMQAILDISDMGNNDCNSASNLIKTKKSLNNEDNAKEVTSKEESSEEEKYFSAQEDITNDEVASEKVASEKVASEEVASEKVASEKVLSEEIASEKIASEKVASEKVANVKNLTAQEKHTEPTNANCSNIDFDIFSVFEAYLKKKNVGITSIGMLKIRSKVYSRLRLLQPYFDFSFISNCLMMDSMPVMIPLNNHVLVIYQNKSVNKVQVVVLNDAQAIALFCDYINIALKKGTTI